MKKPLNLLKSYIYIIFGLIYFGLYFLLPDIYIFSYIKNQLLYGDIVLSYFNAIFGSITILGVSNIFIKIFGSIFQRFADKTKTKLDDVLGEFIVKFLNLSKYVAALYTFFYLAIITQYIQNIVDHISSVLIIIIFLSLSTSFVNIIFEKELIFKSKLRAVSKTLLPFIKKIIIVFIWVIGIITIIGNLGYDVTALVAGAGIGGLAVALAAQKSLTNVFGAITILLNKPFKVGDYVNINNHIGTVKDIGLSYLTIIDEMGHQVMIPNEMIISTSVENYTVRQNRRTDFSIGVIYGTTLEKMEEGVRIIEGILEKYVEEQTISSYRVNFDMFGDFSLNINVTYFSLINSKYIEYLKQKEKINLEIKKQFGNAGLDMAFPTQELILKKES